MRRMRPRRVPTRAARPARAIAPVVPPSSADVERAAAAESIVSVPAARVSVKKSASL